MSTWPSAIAVTLIGPRPYDSGTFTVSPTATSISHVPSAHGPVGEGDGVDDGAGVAAGPDAGPEPDPLGRLSEEVPSEEPEEHEVRSANAQTATAAAAAVDDVLIRIMRPLNPDHPPRRGVIGRDHRHGRW
jgi:hypothetical protein